MGISIATIKRIWSKRSSESWLNYLRSRGMRIGKGTRLFAWPSLVLIDLTRPWLIEIGDNVQITIGVKILTHGYDWSVLKGKYGEVLGSAGKVKIGDNCFIGMNTVILKGTTIGNNTIIGSGSLVTGGVYPSDCVIAGNPARVICSLAQYRKKRHEAQIKEAVELTKEYYAVYKKVPPKEVLAEFFWLFENRTDLNNKTFISKMKCVNNYEESMNVYLKSKPLFPDYNSFISYALRDAVNATTMENNRKGR